MFTAVITPLSKFQVAPIFAVTENPSTNQESGLWEFPDENELADELLAALSEPVPTESTPEIAPEDFESIYKWFLS